MIRKWEARQGERKLFGEHLFTSDRATEINLKELLIKIYIEIRAFFPSQFSIFRLFPFQVNLELEKSGEDLLMHFPITVATVPFRIPNSDKQPKVTYGESESINVVRREIVFFFFFVFKLSSSAFRRGQ